jgi:hypothetical protein
MVKDKKINPHYLTLHSARSVQTVQPLLFSEVFFMEEIETWKVIEGWPDYMVSDLGRIKSFKWNREKILRPLKKVTGYTCTRLEHNKKTSTLNIHRLVMKAFIPNPLNKKECNHKNGIRFDNRACNLEWCTKQENMLHSYRVLKRKAPWTGLTGIKSRYSFKINQYSLDGEFIKTWDAIMDVTRQLGIDPSSIVRVCKKRKKTAGGFKWEYLNKT